MKRKATICGKKFELCGQCGHFREIYGSKIKGEYVRDYQPSRSIRHRKMVYRFLPHIPLDFRYDIPNQYPRYLLPVFYSSMQNQRISMG